MSCAILSFLVVFAGYGDAWVCLWVGVSAKLGVVVAADWVLVVGSICSRVVLCVFLSVMVWLSGSMVCYFSFGWCMCMCGVVFGFL